MKNPIIFCLCLCSMVFISSSLWASAEFTVKDVETAFIKQDYVQAKSIAEQIIAQEPSEDVGLNEIHYYAALCDLRLGQYDLAREKFTVLIGKELNDNLRDKVYLGLFDSYYMDGQYSEALDTIQDLYKLSPRSEFLSLIYLKLARANLKLAKWQKAREYLKKITSNFPDSLEYHVATQLLNEKQYFAVQVGAFIDQERAKKLTEELKNNGEYAYVVETVDKQNRTFYRVRVGQLVMLDKAEKLKTKLSNEGYPTEIYP